MQLTEAASVVVAETTEAADDGPDTKETAGIAEIAGSDVETPIAPGSKVGLSSEDAADVLEEVEFAEDFELELPLMLSIVRAEALQAQHRQT